MDQSARLPGELGLFGATMMGLGSIVGTGIFVSIALATAVSGPAVLLAIALAALLALCNALNSAQLAAAHPVSGGTYEYGYVYLTPWLGFAAGWLFLCAKSASAATAALGAAAYLLVALGVDHHAVRVALALLVVVILVGIVLGGMRRSSAVNIAIVSITLAALIVFVIAGMPEALRHAAANLFPFFADPNGAGGAAHARLVESAALMFVAYTGYGRIATLGEEVRAPRRTIPRAIVLTLVVSAALYLLVGFVGVAAAGTAVFGLAGAERAAPLAVVAETIGVPGGAIVLSIGAITAMLGVLLNLILGLSRVVLAMGRRGDLPGIFARIDARGVTPAPAVVVVGVVIAALVAIGSIRLAWSFSAFSVLIYYAITNLAALRLPRDERLYHPVVAWLGLAGCLALAFQVDRHAWIAGLVVLGAGLVARGASRLVRRRPAPG